MLGKLLELAGRKCRESNCLSCYTIQHKFSGCTLIISGVCQKGHQFQWTSSCTIGKNCGKAIHEDNILFAMAIVLSGNNFQKIEILARILKLHVISRTTFHMYQRLYICPGIEKYFFKTQVLLVVMCICQCTCICKCFVPMVLLYIILAYQVLNSLF